MKRMLPLCTIFFAVLPALAFSQSKSTQKSDKEIIALICHTWKSTQMETNGKVYTLPPEKSFGIVVKADGTMVETDQGTTYPGKWTLSHGIFSVTNDGTGPVETYKIIKITDTELIYETNEDGTMTKIKMKRGD